MLVTYDKINKFLFCFDEKVSIHNINQIDEYYNKIVNVVLKNKKDKNKKNLSDFEIFEMHKRNMSLYDITMDHFMSKNYDFYGSYENFLYRKFSSINSYHKIVDILLKDDITSNDVFIKYFFDMMGEGCKYSKIDDNNYKIMLKYIFFMPKIAKYKIEEYVNNTLFHIIFLYYLSKCFINDKKYDIFNEYIDNMIIYHLNIDKNKRNIEIKNKNTLKDFFNKIEKTNIDLEILEKILFYEKRNKNGSFFTKFMVDGVDDFEIITKHLLKKKEIFVNEFDENYKFVVFSDSNKNKNFYKKIITKEKIKSFCFEYYSDKIYFIPSKMDEESISIFLKINDIEYNILSYKDILNLLNVFGLDYLSG